ncbi:MAG TPA: C-terminal binding protein [Planctomycetaceae bacterium]|nr:C-terminal binding protein [Planctomycetaceae bacterium]
MPLALVTDFIHEPLEIEREVLSGVAEVHAVSAMSTQELLDSLDNPVLAKAEALLVYHFVSITEAVMEKLPQLKIVVRCGAGYDNVDRVAATRRGVLVTNVPDYGTEDVADSTMAMILSLMRGTHRMSQICQRGTDNWKYELVVPLNRVRGQTIGIIGLGRIGTATALRAKAHGLNVVYYDPYCADGTDKAIGVHRAESLSELLAQSNVVSCHCVLNDETHHIIDSEAIAQMPRGSFVVNTSRGGVVDVSAVLAAIESGQLAGAGIDVLETEPPAENDLLMKLWRDPEHPVSERLILTPHAAFYSEQGLEDMRRKGSQNVRRMLTDQQVRNIVNDL